MPSPVIFPSRQFRTGPLSRSTVGGSHWHDLLGGVRSGAQAPKSLGLVLIDKGAIVAEENIYADVTHQPGRFDRIVVRSVVVSAEAVPDAILRPVLKSDASGLAPC